MKLFFLSVGQALLTAVVFAVFTVLMTGVVMGIGYLNMRYLHSSMFQTLSFIGFMAFVGLIAMYYRINRS
jgi:hypothetical protein